MDNSKVKNERNKTMKIQKQKKSEMKILTQSPSSLSPQRTCDIAIKSHPVKVNNSNIVVPTDISTS